MKDEQDNNVSFTAIFSRIFIIVLFFLIIAFVLGCNTKDSRGIPRNPKNYTHDDSLIANLIDPEILYRKAERYIRNYYIKEAQTTCMQITGYYKSPEDSFIRIKANKLLDSIQKLISTPTSEPISAPALEKIEKTPRQIEAEFLKNKDFIGLYKYYFGKPDSEEDFVSGTLKIKTLTWRCAGGKYRSVDFEFSSGIWLKKSEYTSECIR